MEGPNILPVLLQQRHQEVDAQMDVLHQFVGSHIDVSYGDRQTQDLRNRLEKCRLEISLKTIISLRIKISLKIKIRMEKIINVLFLTFKTTITRNEDGSYKQEIL